MSRLSSYIASLLLLMPAALLPSCDDNDAPTPDTSSSIPEGMVEIRPELPGVYNLLPRDPATLSRKYETNEETNTRLETSVTEPLPQGSTVWLIAENNGKLVKNSYVVYNSDPEGSDAKSYLVPCVVDDNGKMTGIEGKPMYLKADRTYEFYALSPARKLDDELFAQGKIGFKIKNGQYFYATDCRYPETSPGSVSISLNAGDGVQRVVLNPMINQTAQLRFVLRAGDFVHSLSMQPSGVYVSGLQDDTLEPPDDEESLKYGDANGISWTMAQHPGEEPIPIQHRYKTGSFTEYDYSMDEHGNIRIEVGVIPTYSVPKPVIVLFRLLVNGVPSTYELMLNEKDFKAGYFYGYRGLVNIEDGVDIVSWQFLGWGTEVDFPF